MMIGIRVIVVACSWHTYLGFWMWILPSSAESYRAAQKEKGEEAEEEEEEEEEEEQHLYMKSQRINTFFYTQY
ncbi:hypothetical protein F5X99DRAFT_245863 [Biscogniauxia marginata]|nr:hypothetical protein F5X99DRAFT_245863 [Biscogniauxia marginata]